jgi:hypothetical protein
MSLSAFWLLVAACHARSPVSARGADQPAPNVPAFEDAFVSVPPRLEARQELLLWLRGEAT